MSDLLVTPDGWAWLDGRRLRCAIGRSGISAAKREGDGATPIGAWACRSLYYRPDRLSRPETGLAVHALTPTDGWCDAPEDPAYNRPVTLPYPAGCESLWREDHVYDLIVPLGYNDDPVVPGLGSAIFLHLARPGYAPTEGCVALAPDDLMAFLARADGSARIVVRSEA
ncbi:MAG TPA: L,D-transpeptidase family protein [Aliidongia sp.]|nr:L,D-transpeptidase family protein [Aliidongia sp.]